jgi:hypothetical protein
MTQKPYTTIPMALPTRRFSEGIETMPAAVSDRRIGRFSDGIAQIPTAWPMRVGRFDDGVATRPDAPSRRRVGSFADGAEQVPGMRAVAAPADAVRVRPDERPTDRRAA